MHNYGLVNTYASIVIAMVVFTSPYCIWIYKEYVKSIPIEIEEAAIIDGAGRLKTFLTVIFPLSAPVIVALSTYAFLYAWNEYLYVLILTSDSRMFTAPLAIFDTSGNILLPCTKVYDKGTSCRSCKSLIVKICVDSFPLYTLPFIK